MKLIFDFTFLSGGLQTIFNLSMNRFIKISRIIYTQTISSFEFVNFMLYVPVNNFSVLLKLSSIGDAFDL